MSRRDGVALSVAIGILLALVVSMFLYLAWRVTP